MCTEFSWIARFPTLAPVFMAKLAYQESVIRSTPLSEGGANFIPLNRFPYISLQDFYDSSRVCEYKRALQSIP